MLLCFIVVYGYEWVVLASVVGMALSLGRLRGRHHLFQGTNSDCCVERLLGSGVGCRRRSRAVSGARVAV